MPMTPYTTAAILFGGCCSIITASANVAQHVGRINDSHRTLQSNDGCVDGSVIASLPYQVSGSTLGSTADFNFESCGANADANGVWYTFTSSETKEVMVSVNSGLGVRVYSGSCDSLTCVSHSDIMHTFVGFANVEYRFLVSSTETTYDFVLNVREAPIPTSKPTSNPTMAPSQSPTKNPTELPTYEPTDTPSIQPSPDVGLMEITGENDGLKEPSLRKVSTSPTYEKTGSIGLSQDSSEDGHGGTHSSKGGKDDYSNSTDCIDEDGSSFSYGGGGKSSSSYSYGSKVIISKAFKSKKPKRKPAYDGSMSYMAKSGKADYSMSSEFMTKSKKSNKSSKKSKCSGKSVKGKQSKSVQGKMSKNDSAGIHSATQLDNARDTSASWHLDFSGGIVLFTYMMGMAAWIGC